MARSVWTVAIFFAAVMNFALDLYYATPATLRNHGPSGYDD